MAWGIKRKGLRYEWSCFFSSHGAATGKAWTRKGAERKLKDAQYKILVEDR